MSVPVYSRGTEREHIRTSSEENHRAGSSSTTTVKVFPDVSRYRRSDAEREELHQTMKAYSLESLKKLHMECFGRPMPTPIAAEVLRDLRCDTPAAYYRYAMMEACYAPRPSWRYVQAIVKRCKAQQLDPSELND